MMRPTIVDDPLVQAATLLGLVDCHDEWFYGRVHDVPTAIRRLGGDPNPHEARLLGIHTPLNAESGFMVQIRFPSMRVRPTPPEISAFEPPLAPLLGSRQARIDVDESTAWLSVFDDFDAGRVRALVALFIDGLRTTGIVHEEPRCHYCRHEQVHRLSFGEGRVAQICDSCLSRRVAEYAAPVDDSPWSSGAAMLGGMVGVVMGAILWTGMWIGIDAARAVLPADVTPAHLIHVPAALWFAPAMLVGVALGGAAAYGIARAGLRDRKRTLTIGCGCLLLIAAMGEWGYARWRQRASPETSVLGVIMTTWTDVHAICPRLMALGAASVPFFMVAPSRKSLRL